MSKATIPLVLVVLALLVWIGLRLAAPGADPVLDEGADRATLEIRKDERPRRATPTADPTARDLKGSGSDPGTEAAATTRPAVIEDGVGLSCVLFGSAEPVAGARIFVIDIGGGPRRPGEALPPFLDRLEGQEPLAITDGDGRAVIARPKRSRLIVAWREDLIGYFLPDPNQDEKAEIRIELAVPRSLPVEVVDAAGRAVAGVELRLRILMPGRPQPLEVEPTITDAQGRASLGLHYHELLAGFTGRPNRAQVALVGLFRKDLSADFDPRAPGPDPVRLVMPPWGSVLVRARPATADFRARMVVGIDDEAAEMAIDFRGMEARARPVETGLALRLLYLPDDGSGDAPQDWKEPGPVADGEEIVVDLDRAARPGRPVLVGRLLTPEGAAVGRTRVVLRPIDGDLPAAGAPLPGFECDEDGRFRRALDAAAAQALATAGLWLQIGDSGERCFVAPIAARAAPAGELDLGEVELERLPIAIAGRVVDARDEPVAGAIVQPDFGDRGAFRESRHFGRFIGTTDADGRFVIRDRCSLERIALVVRQRGIAETRVDARIGDANLMVRLAGEGRIRLQCRAPAGRALPGLALVLTRADGRPLDRVPVIPADGRLDFPLEAGRYDLAIHRDLGEGRRSRDSVFAREGVEVAPGAIVDLGEIRIDLPGTYVELQVDLPPSAADARVEWSVFEVGGRRSVAAGFSRTPGGTTLGFQVESLPVDVLLFAEGCRYLRRTLTEDRARLVLSPGLEVRLRIRNEAGIPEGATMGLRVHDRQGNGANANICFGRRGVEDCRLSLPGPGRYDLLLNLDGRSIELGQEDWAEKVSRRDLEVGEQEEAQVLEIVLRPGFTGAPR
ncbi:MAG: carboxypeptidase regulatory-like domain-containing protein [Planctomycetes bacterium]|nr:carboxypeptidase regulatory-like domain-containing protein [Planctomycetota bacterium]